MQSAFALIATAFFIAFAAIVAIYGGETARYLVAVAMFIGAISQFIAQDDRARIASIVLAYVAMGFGAAALVMWA